MNPREDFIEWKKMNSRVKAFKAHNWPQFSEDYTLLGLPPLALIAFVFLISSMFAIALLFLTSIVVK